jgi:hypothetical protein
MCRLVWIAFRVSSTKKGLNLVHKYCVLRCTIRIQRALLVLRTRSYDPIQNSDVYSGCGVRSWGAPEHSEVRSTSTGIIGTTALLVTNKLSRFVLAGLEGSCTRVPRTRTSTVHLSTWGQALFPRLGYEYKYDFIIRVYEFIYMYIYIYIYNMSQVFVSKT